jgi:hypothetical protein
MANLNSTESAIRSVVNVVMYNDDALTVSYRYGVRSTAEPPHRRHTVRKRRNLVLASREGRSGRKRASVLANESQARRARQSPRKRIADRRFKGARLASH